MARAFIVICALWVAWYFWYAPAPMSLAPGIAWAPSPPLQQPPESRTQWTVGDYVLTPLAAFELDAVVLLRDRYWFGAEAELAPIDLTLAWGPLSDSAISSRIRFTHGHRVYRFRYTDANISNKMVSTHTANMHLIPADAAVRESLIKVKPGMLIRLEGVLVEVNHPNGFRWRSSITRNDTGMGSCELIWVQEVWELDPDVSLLAE